LEKKRSANKAAEKKPEPEPVALVTRSDPKKKQKVEKPKEVAQPPPAKTLPPVANPKQ
jgi:hypothetical protein